MLLPSLTHDTTPRTRAPSPPEPTPRNQAAGAARPELALRLPARRRARPPLNGTGQLNCSNRPAQPRAMRRSHRVHPMAVDRLRRTGGVFWKGAPGPVPATCVNRCRSTFPVHRFGFRGSSRHRHSQVEAAAPRHSSSCVRGSRDLVMTGGRAYQPAQRRKSWRSNEASRLAAVSRPAPPAPP